LDSDERHLNTPFDVSHCRLASIAEHAVFLDELGLKDRVVLNRDFIVSDIAQARSFVDHWLRNRNVAADFSELIGHVALSEKNPGSFWIECKLAEHKRVYSDYDTATWHKAYHGTDMSVLLSIIKQGRLETGPRGKKSTRHGRLTQYGVFCHKHGTSGKAANYLQYFQYSGFIAAALFKLSVRGFVACGDQWCCQPQDVQIDSVWIHVVPFEFVGMQRYWIFNENWRPEYELHPAMPTPVRVNDTVAG